MLRKKVKSQALISIGLFCLALGSTSLSLLPRHTSLSGDITDAITGFLYGVAITTLLIGVWRKSRHRSSEDEHCA